MSDRGGPKGARFRDQILEFLRQGLDPDHLARAIAFGIACACTPLLGTATIVAFAVAGVLRLNPVVIQAANYAAYPIQIALILPFIRLGEWMTGAVPVSLDPTVVREQLTGSPLAFASTYGEALLRGTLAWAVVAIPLALLLERILRVWLRSLARSIEKRKGHELEAEA